MTARISSRVKSGCLAIRAKIQSECSSNGETLPPLRFGAALPVSLQRWHHRITELTPTLKISAISRRDAPLSTASTARSRKSVEYGLGIDLAPQANQFPQICRGDSGWRSPDLMPTGNALGGAPEEIRTPDPISASLEQRLGSFLVLGLAPAICFYASGYIFCGALVAAGNLFELLATCCIRCAEGLLSVVFSRFIPFLSNRYDRLLVLAARLDLAVNVLSQNAIPSLRIFVCAYERQSTPVHVGRYGALRAS